VVFTGEFRLDFHGRTMHYDEKTAAMKMKTNIVLLLIAALAFSGCDSRKIIRLESLTGIDLPEGCSDVVIVEDTSDVKAFWVTAHVTIPKQKLKDFLESNGFTRSGQKKLIILPGLGRLPERFQKPSDPSNLFVLARQIDDERGFEMMVDATSGSLWMMATFPD
jgi:hypothetical protein